jgi:hypothetical protein
MRERILTVLVVLVLVSLSLGVYAFLQLNNVQNNALYTKQVTIISGWVDMGYQNAWIQNNYTSSVHNITIEYTIMNYYTHARTDYFQLTSKNLDVNQSETIRINQTIQTALIHSEHSIYIVLISAFGYSIS